VIVYDKWRSNVWGTCNHFFFNDFVVGAGIVSFRCWDGGVADEVRQRDVGLAMILGEVVLEDLRNATIFL
jgi:hypothetical protein